MNNKPREQLGQLNARMTGFRLLLFLLFVYHCNLTFLPGDDAAGNVFLPVSILKDQRITFTPDLDPFMFVWRRNGTDAFAPPLRVSTVGWRSVVKGWPESIGLHRGELELVEERYFITRSIRQGVFVNTFGMGTAIVALPFYGLVHFTFGLDRFSNHFLWHL
jgi:hypothetical protein